LSKSGDLTTLRFVFAFLKVGERNRDYYASLSGTDGAAKERAVMVY